MLIILDGYNVIHAIPELEEKLNQNLKTARDSLVQVCQELQQKRGDIEKFLIVFDGSSRFADLPAGGNASVEIVYTESGEDADDRIVSLVASFGRKKPVSVVSNDNYIVNNVRAFGVNVISVKEFQAFMTKRNKIPPKNRTQKKTRLDDDLARDVTEEYRKHLGIE